MKSINLTALKKHGKVYEDGEFCYGHFFFFLVFWECYHHGTSAGVHHTVFSIFRAVWLPGLVTLRDAPVVCGGEKETKG